MLRRLRQTKVAHWRSRRRLRRLPPAVKSVRAWGMRHWQLVTHRYNVNSRHCTVQVFADLVLRDLKPTATQSLPVGVDDSKHWRRSPAKTHSHMFHLAPTAACAQNTRRSKHTSRVKINAQHLKCTCSDIYQWTISVTILGALLVSLPSLVWLRRVEPWLRRRINMQHQVKTSSALMSMSGAISRQLAIPIRVNAIQQQRDYRKNQCSVRHAPLNMSAIDIIFFQ